MTKRLFVLLLIGGLGCQQKRDAAPVSPTVAVVKVARQDKPDVGRNCPDSMDAAVMRAVNSSITTVGYDPSSADLAREQADIYRVFAWSKTLPDATMRNCYESWLGYHQYMLDHFEMPDLIKAQQQREWEKSHSVPMPPKSR